MIYTQKGLISNKLEKVESDKDIFNYIYSYTPQAIDLNSTKDNYKKNKAMYFISGEVKPNEDGSYTRNNSNVMYRDVAVLDIEDTNYADNVLINIFKEKLKPYKHIYYPSISHTEQNPRYRIIVDLDKKANKEEYKETIKGLYHLIGVGGDDTATTYSQLQGLPITTEADKNNYAVVYNDGKPFPVIETKQSEKEARETITITASNISNIAMLDDTTAIELFKGYIEVDKDNLQDYNNSLAVIMTLAKAVVKNEISYEVAIECSELLALDNPKWKDGNFQKLNTEITNSKGNVDYFKNSYSFKDRMKAPIKKAHNNNARQQLIKLWNDTYTNAVNMFSSLEWDELEAETKEFIQFKNNYELKQFLYSLGEQWRDENTTINEKTGEDKVPVMDFTIVSKYLRKYVPMVLIGDNEDLAGLYVYDFDKGIYIQSTLAVEKLISTIENRYNPRKYTEVIKHIRTKIKYVERLENSELIACNNGIFNLTTKTLHDFNPSYILTSKLATNYNANAVEDYNSNYRNTFDVDKWIMSISNQDEEINTLLWQVFNEAINPNFTRRKIGIMLGSGKNGKGTYQAILTALIGKGNIATLKPPQFTTQFQISQLKGKVCNIGDDISHKPIDEIDVIKSIASGDPITIDEKHKNPITYAFKTFLLFSANDMPTTSEKTQAVLDRLLIIPFNADFHGQKEDRSIKDKHVKDNYVLEYVLYKALHLDFEHFINPKASQEALNEYTEKNDSVYDFAVNWYIPEGYHLFPKMPKNILDKLYNDFCTVERIRNPRRHVGKTLATHLTRQTKTRYTYKKARLNANETDKLFKIPNTYANEVPIVSTPVHAVVKE